MLRLASLTSLTSLATLAISVVLAGCGGGNSPSSGSPTNTADAAPVVRAPQIGDGKPGSVVLTELLGPSAKLLKPRDLAFNPLRPNELWIVNWGDDSMVIVMDALASTLTSERRKDAAANHFMAKPAGFAFGGNDTSFGKPGTFATCNESRNTYDDKAAPNDFMGPGLWSSDLSVFAMMNPNGLGSHLDMLHNSPLCVGIAHESANVYWEFSGKTNSIVKYDFVKDNGIGNDEHADGAARRYINGQLKYVEGVVGHLVFNAADSMLYIADTGNGRIAKLDTNSGMIGRKLAVKEPMAGFNEVDGAVLTDVVPGGGALVKPAGLELQDNLLFVSDNETSKILAYTLEGEKVNELDTGLPPGSLAGMAFGPDKKLYFVDVIGNRVFRVDPTAR